MIKGVKILFFVFFLGTLVFPQQMAFAQEIAKHEICCCSTNPEHQNAETSNECCGTSCQDCSILHSHNLSVLYFQVKEEFQINKFFTETTQNNFHYLISLPKGMHNIWQPPKIG
ncbi:MAG: hypothetical protein Q4A00_03380 [Flavobacteriaceae bacterium]|nr:hypothetical protein [Flavobacteriaceae bacterium]